MLSDYKKIGITGSDGFIGSRVRARLRELQVPHCNFEGDLLRDDDVRRYFLNNKVEQIINLVGSFDLPFENQIRLNVLSVQKLLEIGIPLGLKKIIFTSTGAVYGEPQREASVETDFLKPNTLYGLSKKYAEDCIQYYANNSNLQFIILRFPNVYGPGSTKGVVYQFLKSIQEKERIVIFGRGEQKRNFLFVDDAVESIIQALSWNKRSEIFNIASEEIYSLNEVAAILKEQGVNFDVEYQPADETNTLYILSENINKAKTMLGWKPTISFQRGLESVLHTTEIILNKKKIHEI